MNDRILFGLPAAILIAILTAAAIRIIRRIKYRRHLQRRLREKSNDD